MMQVKVAAIYSQRKKQNHWVSLTVRYFAQITTTKAFILINLRAPLQYLFTDMFKQQFLSLPKLTHKSFQANMVINYI